MPDTPESTSARRRDGGYIRITFPVVLAMALFMGAVFLALFPSLERTILQERQRNAEELATSAVEILRSLQGRVDYGELSLSQAQSLAATILRSMHYGQDNRDYFWIIDLKPRMIMHPYRPDLEGRDLADYTDSTGRHPFLEMVRTALGRGHQPMEYLWQWQNDSTRIVPKMAFVKLFDAWGWIVGTGVYVRDVQAEISRMRGTLLTVGLGLLLVMLLLGLYIIQQGRRAETRRRELFDALSEQEALYRSLLDNLPLGVILVNHHHEILAANAQLRAWFPDLDLPARPICQLSLPDPRSNDPCKPCPVNQTFADGEIHARTLDIPIQGETRTFRVTASPVRDAFGRISTAIETFIDITESVRAEAQVRRAEHNYRAIFENALEGIYQSTLDGRYLGVNPSLARIYGYDSPEDLIRSLNDIAAQLYVDPGRREEFRKIMARDGSVSDFRSQVRRRDGSVIWISENARLAHDPDGVHYEGTVEDITAAIQAEEDLLEQKAFFQELFESSPLAIAMVDAAGLLIDVNRSFESTFGHRKADIVGQYERESIVPERLSGEAEAFRRSLLKGNTVNKETERRSADGALVPVEFIGSPIRLGERIVGAYHIYRDITERREFERQLSHQAFHDSLTALPNRSLYMERLRHAVERGRRREGYNFAVLMIDLNRFKRVNDTLGHHVGDQLLVGIALRILSCIRTVDTVARLGGDEFAVLLEEFESPREVIRVSNRIAGIMSTPFTIEGHNIHSGASIGIVLHTRDYESAEDILRDADIAMYQAKERGKARLVFNRRMHAQAVKIGRMENELRAALAERQFMLYYQPIVDVGSRRIKGFEALVRWRHPERGVVGPTEFIPLAEETGLIVPLGHWVIREACRQMSEWLRQGYVTPDMSISVNLSARQFSQADLVESIQRALDETGLPPANLKFEITESVIMQDTPVASAKLGRLKNMGLQIMIDDFGTGYSSLSYLQQFPVDYLKIDRSFISGDGDDQEKLEIVRTIVSLARSLGLGVVAEGVEREDQFDRLRSMNCDNAQGYMFSRPVDRETAEDMLRNWPPAANSEES